MPLKLVARKNFYNHPKLNIVGSKDGGKDGKPVLKHRDQIHKGMRFDFGPANANVYEDFPAGSAEKEMLQQLVYARAVTIIEDTAKSKSIVAKIDAEVADEKSADDAFQQRIQDNRPATLKDVLAALPDLIKQMAK
jgi:hypothetical protein